MGVGVLLPPPGEGVGTRKEDRPGRKPDGFVFTQSDRFSGISQKALEKHRTLQLQLEGFLPPPRAGCTAHPGSLSVSPLSSPRRGLSPPCALDDTQSPCPVTIPPLPRHPARAEHVRGVLYVS